MSVERRSRILRSLIAVAVVLVVAGVVGAQIRTSICDVQEYDEQGLSPLLGQMVTVRGTVTCPPGYYRPEMTVFFIESGDCGVQVFIYEWNAVSATFGDSVEVSGEVVEYISSGTGAGATTEILSDAAQVSVLSTGNPAPTPTEVTCAEVNMEENEGRLLGTTGVVTVMQIPWSFYVSDGTDEVEIYLGMADSVSFPGIHIGDTLCVTGVLAQYDRTSPFFDGYELMPRTNRDIRECTATAVRKSSWAAIKALFR